MSILIAATACIDRRAEIADDVEVGPFCVVGPGVRIGRGSRLLERTCLTGEIALGEFNTIGPLAAIGGEAQDVSYRGTPTRIEVGDFNLIQERVTIHRATEKEEGITRVGSHNVLRANCHVAHDCNLEDGITLGIASILGGHVHVESYAHVCEGVAVHPFVTIGGRSFVGPKSKVTRDVPRFLLVEGNPAEVRGINVAGLERGGLDAGQIGALREAHRLLYGARMGLERASGVLESHGYLTPEVRLLLDFIRAQHAGARGRAREHRSR
jgi:UDP-N-acetylglucosamine acyltransferase